MGPFVFGKEKRRDTSSLLLFRRNIMNREDFYALAKAIEKPPLYAKSTAPFWEDPHIAKEMLKAHLDSSCEAASRPFSFIDASVDWIVRYCKLSADARILDLGCGPGLYTRRFAKRNYQVTGVDLSPGSLAYARKEAGEKEHYLLGDYVEMDLPQGFSLILLIFCDFGVLSDTARDTLLDKVYQALKPGGWFVFDVFTPLRTPSSSGYQLEREGFFRPHPHLVLQNHFTYGVAREIHLDQYVVVDEKGTEVYRIWDHRYTRESLAPLVAKAGFRDIQFFSDVAGRVYEKSQDTLGVLARKPLE